LGHRTFVGFFREWPTPSDIQKANCEEQKTHFPEMLAPDLFILGHKKTLSASKGQERVACLDLCSEAFVEDDRFDILTR
jgi:hypothetical protein